ncbi:MAG: phosphate acyltransferase, partial [Pseudomonadota bacterium]|nr:phosphate acyltransferase [Pseudomonadota bacterium]
MNQPIAISLDAMGGDLGAEVVVPAAINALRRFDDIELILVGDEQIISAQLVKIGQCSSARLRIEHTTEKV